MSHVTTRKSCGHLCTVKELTGADYPYKKFRTPIASTSNYKIKLSHIAETALRLSKKVSQPILIEKVTGGQIFLPYTSIAVGGIMIKCWEEVLLSSYFQRNKPSVRGSI